jgi:hypothetical protein
MYSWLLFGHLLGVVLFVTGWAIYVAGVDGLRRARSVAQLRTLSGLTTLGERVLIGGGPLLIGFGLVLAAEYYSFSQPWLVAALAHVALQGAAGAAVVGPRAHRIRAALETAADGPLTATLTRLARDRILHVANRASIPVLFNIEFLMTVKPLTADIVASLLVVTALALVLCWPVLNERPPKAPPIATTQ